MNLYLEASRCGCLIAMKCQKDGIYENKGKEKNPLLISQKNHNGQQGGSVLTGTKEDVLGGKLWLPLGLGLKGNSQSCLCL